MQDRHLGRRIRCAGVHHQFDGSHGEIASMAHLMERQQLGEYVCRSGAIQSPQRPVVDSLLRVQLARYRLLRSVEVLRDPDLPYAVTPLGGLQHWKHEWPRMQMVMRVEVRDALTERREKFNLRADLVVCGA